MGEIVRFRANQVPGENHQWKSGVVTDLIRPGDPNNLWEAQSVNYVVLSDRLNTENLIEETITSEGNMEALVDYPFVESKGKPVARTALFISPKGLTLIRL